MSYAIVGFGKIGQALAHAFARKNIEVTVASRRSPEALAPEARAIGPTVVAKSLRDALEADTIILAVPFEEHREIAKALPSWKGKTVIDAMNSFPIPPEELDGLPSSAFVAKSFTGAKLVKGFNHLVAATLATDPIVEGGHRFAAGERDGIGVLCFGSGLLPLVIAIGRDQAAALLECSAEGGLCGSFLGAGIDGVQADARIFGPGRHQPPAHDGSLALTAVPAESNYRLKALRGGVPGGCPAHLFEIHLKPFSQQFLRGFSGVAATHRAFRIAVARAENHKVI
jgi:hypothetical protein